MLAEPVEQIFEQSAIGPSTMGRLPAFYQGVVKAWLDMNRKRSAGEWVIPCSGLMADIPLSKLTSRVVYLGLSQLQDTPHRCINKNPTVEWPTVWSNLNSLSYVRSAPDTSWLIAHGTLSGLTNLQLADRSHIS